LKVYVVGVLFVIPPSHAKYRKREKLYVWSVKVKVLVSRNHQLHCEHELDVIAPRLLSQN